MYLELLVFIFHLNCQYVYDAERSLPFLSFNFPQQWKSYLKKNKKNKNKSSCMKVTEWSCVLKNKNTSVHLVLLFPMLSTVAA